MFQNLSQHSLAGPPESLLFMLKDFVHKEKLAKKVKKNNLH